MERRTFLKFTTAAAASTVIPIPDSVKDWLSEIENLQDPVFESFINPSHDAFPYTWWHWMNGNVTREGIQLDLDFLHRAGIGGFQLFQVGTGIPKGPVNFGSDEWLNLLKFSAEYASRLGLEFDMMNCGGWSSSGGPWITPELAMKQLTWTEVQVKGGRNIQIQLPKPYVKLNYYKDTYVLAFPTPGKKQDLLGNLIRKVTTGNQEIGPEVFTTGVWDNGIDIIKSDESGYYTIQLELNNVFLARSITIFGGINNTQFSFLQPQQNNQVELQVSSDGNFFDTVCNLNLQAWRTNVLELPISKNFKISSGRYFRIRSLHPLKVFYIRLLPSECILDWPLKANYQRIGSVIAGQQLTPMLNCDPDSIVPLDHVIDLTSFMNEQGILSWNAPEGYWTIIRMGYTPIGIQNHPSPDGGGGLECDKYSKQAYDYHFDQFFGKLYPVLESLGSKGLSGAIIDSYEVGMQTWTEELPQEFLRRRGYDFTKYLPALVGYIIDNPIVSDKFLWDIRRTHADLMADNYYGRFAELCRQHNMKSYVEPYSGGPFDEIQVGAKVDVPMGEFWAGMDQANGVFYSIKLASSIAHVYGKKIVAAESYTGIPSQTKWQLHPYAMKGQGDWMYTLGLNKFIFHVYAMQPHPTAKPGMTMGPWGWMHSRNNTWAEQEKFWIQYVQRTQSLLQEGRIVADLLYFVGEEVPVDTPVLPEQLFPTPPNGYYYDVIDRGGILTRLQVNENKISLPDGVTYSLLILPNTEIISIEVLQKIKELVNAGAHVVVNSKPISNPGLNNYPQSDNQLQELVQELWQNLDGINHKEVSYGKGKLYWNLPLEEILNDRLQIGPDFIFTSKSGDAPINYIHRQIGDADIYFIANRRREYEELVCTFRVSNKLPEIWDPINTETINYPVYEPVAGGIRIPIHLEPAGSKFIIFRKNIIQNDSLVSIKKDNDILISTKPGHTPSFIEKYSLYVNNFTISCFLKPETEITLAENAGWIGFPTSWVFYPLPGREIYGEMHANCGLCVGRNGIIVYERNDDQLKPVLSLSTPLSGWSHIALIYEAGVPRIYVNGQFIGQGERSDFLVHPGLNQSFQNKGATYFHGELRNLVAYNSILSEQEIKNLAISRIPTPDQPFSWGLVSIKNMVYHQFWSNGAYALLTRNGQNISFVVRDIPNPIEINSPWEVIFPENSGAPHRIVMERLISLKDHELDGVKYFSGTATYNNRFVVDKSYIRSDIRLYIDLGWVEVIAEVWINQNYVGASWKVPHRLDVTDYIRSGSNSLTIKVTNLWPNRLIGDEHLPPENEYNGNGIGPRAEFMASIKKLPDWYVEGKPKPSGGRITFTTWKHYSKNDPLLDSGLLGPVRIIPCFIKEDSFVS